MTTHTDYFVQPDAKLKWEKHGSTGTIVLTVGDYLDGVDLFFHKESLPQLLALADQCEKAWSASLEPDQR